MKITKERLTSLLLQFFTDIKGESFYSLARKTQFDQKTLKSWRNLEINNIRKSSVDTLISHFHNEIQKDYSIFSDFLMQKLEIDEISRDYIKDIILSATDLSVLFKELQSADISTPLPMQKKIGTARIIQDIKSFLSQYRDYFQVSEKLIGENDAVDYFSSLVYIPKYANTKEHSSVSEENYIIIKFPNAYHVCILLSNYSIDEQLADFSLRIEKFKVQHDLKMIIIATDNPRKSISLEFQSFLMEQHNLFFEFIKPTDLNNIPIQGLKLFDMNVENLSKRIVQYQYAQLIFERFMSYLTVISNEIVFLPYLDKLKSYKEFDSENATNTVPKLNNILVSYQKRTNINNFTAYARNLLLKDICSYSYLPRHAIYHERTLVKDTLNTFLKEEGLEKLPLAVEICAPNSLTTIDIIDKCEKILLFTASHTAYSVMTKLHQKTGKRFLPPNVDLRLSHLNPEYMMHQYRDEFTGKIDLLVIGFGTGSQINDLTTFLRYAYNWLSEKGIIFISVYNKDAIVLDKKHFRDQRFENSPLYFSDYWVYTRDDRNPLLKKLKSYSPEDFQSTYLSLFDTQLEDLSTYPYLSALINPTEYSREILDEIRSADKLFAKQGTHGQLINVIGRKNKNRLAKESIEIVKHYLASKKIPHTLFTHTLAPDSHSLRRSLQAQNISMSNATVLKTVILQEIPNKNQWIFAILPHDKRVVYNQSKYEIVPESLIIKRYHQGTISPLTVIAETTANNYTFDNVYLLYSDTISTEFVIMGCGSNSESVQMKTNTFRKLIKKHNISSANILE